MDSNQLDELNTYWMQQVTEWKLSAVLSSLIANITIQKECSGVFAELDFSLVELLSVGDAAPEVTKRIELRSEEVLRQKDVTTLEVSFFGQEKASQVTGFLSLEMVAGARFVFQRQVVLKD